MFADMIPELLYYLMHSSLFWNSINNKINPKTFHLFFSSLCYYIYITNIANVENCFYRGIKLEYGEFCLAEMNEKDGKGGLYLEVSNNQKS